MNQGPVAGAATATAEYRYRINGLTLSSPRLLPFLWGEPVSARPADAALAFAAVTIPAEMPVHQARRLAVYADGRGLHQAISGARFLIEGGDKITIDLPAGTKAAELHALLCGPPMGWLMYQRQSPPIHACVVKVGSMAVALAGDSGAGKSTLARALIGRGHRLVSDDQAVVDPATGLVYPGYPAMKLWRSTALSAGDEIVAGHRVREGLEKYYIPMPAAFEPAPLPLRLVLVLSAGVERRLEQVQRHGAAAVLTRCLYRPEFSRAIDGGLVAFQWAVTLSRTVPVFRLERSEDLADLEGLVACVESLAAGNGA